MANIFLNLVESLSPEAEPINELFGPTINAKATRLHDTLNPALWENDQLKPGVLDKLLQIKDEFLKSTKVKIDNIITDVVICGSNVNYNYTNGSDLDLHILIDSRKVRGAPETKEYLKKLLGSKSLEFNSKHSIKIYGVPVEVFVEDYDVPKPLGAIYSIGQNKWLKQPNRAGSPQTDEVTRNMIKKQAKLWIGEIDTAIATGDVANMRAAFGKIRDARSEALNTPAMGGLPNDTTVPNLAYKIVNRMGYFAKLFKAMDEHTDRSLSLESYQPLREFIDLTPPALTYHETLNQDIWNPDDTLKPEVREKLLAVAKHFITFIKVPLKVEDIWFKGSMANYNYTSRSDIDVHVVASVTDEKNLSIIEARRLLWKQKYSNVSIKGFPVEMMVEEPGKKHSSSAVFSLKNNEWVLKPEHYLPYIDKYAVNKLTKRWLAELRAAIKTGDLKKVVKARQNIIGIRSAVLDGSPGAEYKVENIAYKRIRDAGIFDLITRMIDTDKETQLSINREKQGIFRR